MESHVIFNESFNLTNVNRIKASLVEMMKSRQKISVQLNADNLPDLAGMQLLASMSHSLSENDNLSITIDDELRSYFLRYGFNCLAAF
jgi:hypothetical protein